MAIALVILKLTAVLATGLLLAWALRRQAAALRHAVLVTTVLGAAAVPLVDLVMPAWIALPASATRAEPARVTLDETFATTVVDTSPGVAATAAGRSVDPLTLLLTAWAAVACLAVGRLARALWRLRSLRHRTTPLHDARWSAALSDVSARLDLRTPVTVRCGDSDAPVITWGLRTPQLLVPASAPQWSDAQMRLVLTHELSHVARRDWAWLVLMEVARALYWWQPLMWLAVRAARRDAEHACDDLVLRHEERPSHYAQVLVDLARTTRIAHSSVVTPITQVSFLERRISAMLDSTINHAPVRQLTRSLVVASLVLVSLAVAGAGAQTPSSTVGTVVGTVRPSGGQPLDNVEVTFSVAGSDVRVKTGADGTFTTPLPAGTHRATIRVPGFKRFESIVDVVAGQQVSRDFALALGSLTESINVAGEQEPNAVAINLRPDVPLTRTLGVIATPIKLVDVRPDYPAALREAGIEGTVKVAARIGVDGHTTDVSVLQSAHPDLSQLASDAIARWRYQPTTVQGVTVATDVTVTVEFKAER